MISRAEVSLVQDMTKQIDEIIASAIKRGVAANNVCSALASFFVVPLINGGFTDDQILAEVSGLIAVIRPHLQKTPEEQAEHLNSMIDDEETK